LHFQIPRKNLLNPLKMVASVLEQRHTLPILANILIKVHNNKLHLTATDAEVEISYALPLEASLGTENDGETTVPGRKFFDIVRSLSDAENIQFIQEAERATIKSGHSRFKLSCLPAEDFPNSPQLEDTLIFKLPQRTLKELLRQTSFAIAQNDVRYYLMGLCFDLLPEKLAVVATDGHRLALATEDFNLEEKEPLQVIVPRKAVLELTRMLDEADEEVEIMIDKTHIKFTISEQLSLSSKLIDGKFPDYYSVLPSNPEQVALADVTKLKTALTQASILSSDKYKGVKLVLSENLIKVSARNPEQEEAEVECEVDYNGESLEMGFNVAYLQDALNSITTAEVALCFTDNNSSCLIKPKDIDNVNHVVMPMRL